jgi:hypothetical protein
MPDPPPNTALVKVTKGSNALAKPKSAGLAMAETAVTKSKSSPTDIAEIVRIGATGGEAAGWGLTGAGVAMLVGIIIHSASVLTFGPVGMAIGVGVYGTRIFDRFRKFRRSTNKELSDYLEDNDLLFAEGRINKREYLRRRRAIIEKSSRFDELH